MTRKKMMLKRKKLLSTLRNFRNDKDEITELKERIDFYTKFKNRGSLTYDSLVAETIDELNNELKEKIKLNRIEKLKKLKEYESEIN